MLDTLYPHMELLTALWFTVAVTLAFLFGTLAEVSAQHGRKGPELIAATTLSLLWPLALVGVLAFGVARGFRRALHRRTR